MGGVCHVPIGIDPAGRRLVRLAPLAERRGDQSGLEFMHRVVVGFAVGLCAPDDPADRRGAMNERSFCRELALPAWPGNRQHLRACPGRSLAWAVEHVSPHVAHLEQIEAPSRIRHADQQRFLRHVEPHQRIERVDVRPHYIRESGVRKCRQIRKLVHRRLAELSSVGDIGADPARQFHQNERIGVDVGAGRDVADQIGRNSGRCCSSRLSIGRPAGCRDKGPAHQRRSREQ